LVQRSHCAVGRFLGCVVFRLRTRTQSKLCVLANPSLSLLQSLTQLDLAGLLEVQLLSWTFFPFSTNQIRRSTYRQASTPVNVTPSGFGYPLDVLLPSNPSETVRLTALLGFTLRSFARGQGMTMFPSSCTHLPFRLRLIRQLSLPHGVAVRGFWALTLVLSPGVRMGFTPPTPT
jgi:hypothetical protein